MRSRVVSVLTKALQTSSEHFLRTRTHSDQLSKALQTSSEPHVPANTQHIAREIEEALFAHHTSEVCKDYIQQARVLKANLRSNALLRAAVLGQNTEVCVMAMCCSVFMSLLLVCLRYCFFELGKMEGVAEQ